MGASVHAHRYCVQSRRDDLEAIGYMITYCLRGKLPWSGLKVQDTVKKYQKIGEMKYQTAPEDLCKGMPEGFVSYLTYTKNLKFAERPDYEKIQQMIVKMRKEHVSQAPDSDLDWLQKKEIRNDLVPLQQWESMPQPDDLVESPGGSCGCFSKRRKSQRESQVIGGTE